MIHHEEYYICDRCGTVIHPGFSVPFSSQRMQVFDIRTDMPEIQEYMNGGIKKLSDVKLGMEIIKNYTYDSKRYHLCYKCRKDFERFMKNENGV